MTGRPTLGEALQVLSDLLNRAPTAAPVVQKSVREGLHLDDAFVACLRDLGSNVVAAFAGSAALIACIDQDDDQIARLLNDLDVEELRDVLSAASLLAEQADARHAALTTIPEETETR